MEYLTAKLTKSLKQKSKKIYLSSDYLKVQTMKITQLLSIFILFAFCSCSTNEYFEKSLKKLSLSKENLFLCKEGWDKTESGNYSEAIGLYDKCIESGNLSNSSLARTYRNIGITYSRMKNYKTAIGFYNKALELNPEDPWNDYINMGNAWDYLGNFKKAFEDYDIALQKKEICASSLPKNVIYIVISTECGEIFYNRGISYERQRKVNEAIIEFEKAYNYGLRTNNLIERINLYKNFSKKNNSKLK